MRAGRRVGGVAAFGHGVVERVVAPVEAVAVAVASRQACCSSEVGGQAAMAAKSQLGVPGGLILIDVAMSKTGSRWMWVRPAHLVQVILPVPLRLSGDRPDACVVSPLMGMAVRQSAVSRIAKQVQA
jgi:hypothetical protein